MTYLKQRRAQFLSWKNEKPAKEALFPADYLLR